MRGEHRYYPDAARRRVTSHDSYYEPPAENDYEFEDWDDHPRCDCGEMAETTYAGHPVCYPCAVSDYEHDEADRLRDDMRCFPEDY